MRCSLALRTARKTLFAVAFSSALIAGAFSAMAIRAWNLTESQSLPPVWKIVGLTIATAGLAARIFLQRGLRAGVQSQRWHEDDLAATRKIAASAAWTAFLWIFFIASIVLLAFSPRGYFFGLFGILPMLSPQEARTILRPPLPRTRPHAANSIYPLKPLHSARWGAPPNSPLP